MCECVSVMVMLPPLLSPPKPPYHPSGGLIGKIMFVVHPQRHWHSSRTRATYIRHLYNRKVCVCTALIFVSCVTGRVSVAVGVAP